MPYPIRKCKRADSCNENHVFAMRSLHTETYYRNAVQMQLCPSLDRDGNVMANTFPVFNRDQKIYTPAFCLDIDKNYPLDQDQQMLMDHVRKVKENCEQKQLLFVPKPSHKNKYCSVCKEGYEDYLDHVEGASHRRAIQKSRFTRDILQLCDSFRTASQKEEKPQISKESKDQTIENLSELPLRKVGGRAQSQVESPDEKQVYTQLSSTNLPALSRDPSFSYSPFGYGMYPNPNPYAYYYYQQAMSQAMRMPGYLPMQFPGFGMGMDPSMFQYSMPQPQFSPFSYMHPPPMFVPNQE